MGSQQTVLLFEIEENKDKQIGILCQSLKIHVLHVKREDYCQKLGYLAGIQGFARGVDSYQGKGLPAEMMVFSGMDSNQVDGFLKEYKGAGIAPIGCKAIITPNNVFWTAEELFRELLHEHMYFQNKK